MEEPVRKNELYEFSFENQPLVLCVPTGQIFGLDSLSRCVLDIADGAPGSAVIAKLAARYGEQQVGQAVRELEQARLLLGPERQTVSPVAAVSTDITNMALYVTDDCNLRCTYCYEAGKCRRRRGSYMRRDTARKAVDLLLDESPSGTNCTVQFFGGEPLLNFPLVKYVVAYCRERGMALDRQVSFTIDTNGTLLRSDIADFCVTENIGVALSIDGPRHVNDRARIFPNGKGSYDTVVDRSRQLLNRMPGKVGARATLTKDNVRFIDTLTHLLGLGFERILIDCDSGSTGTWNDTEIRVLKNEFEKAALYFIESYRQGSFFSFGNIVSLFPLIQKAEKKSYHCGAGIWYVAIAPDGTVYPCHRLVDIPELAMGNVHTGVSWSLRETVLSHAVESKPFCKDCWARYLCGGGCLYRGLVATGDPYVPDPAWCELTRHVLTLAMGLFSEIRRKGGSEKRNEDANENKTSYSSTVNTKIERNLLERAGE